MRTVAVIQARLGSTRLPGKVLLPLAGKSMLQNVIERVKRAKLIDYVVVNSPDVELGSEIKAPCCFHVRDGDENDLIGAFYHSARSMNADFIIRICADNPCVEPGFIDDLIDWRFYYSWKGLKKRLLILNSESFDACSDGFGGELYTLPMLEWMDRIIKDPFYREHPHKLWQEMGAYFYVGNGFGKDFRLDVNTRADYEHIRNIYDHFGHNRFHVEEVVKYISEKKQTERMI